MLWATLWERAEQRNFEHDAFVDMVYELYLEARGLMPALAMKILGTGLDALREDLRRQERIDAIS
jgi:hypothetical protein